MTDTARIYGGSLYELAAEESLTGSVLEQMSLVRDLFRQEPEYVRLLSEPSIPLKERQSLIEEAFGSGMERYLVSFIKLLCEKGLLAEYAGCCREYEKKYNADNGIVEALVTSAVPLTGSQADALRAKLEAQSGKKVSLSFKTDPAVVAGLRVEMEGIQLDGTVAGRLAGISRRLEEVTVCN